MNFLTLLQQLLGNCSGGTCQAATQAAQTATGLPNILTMLCRLFGIGC